MIGNATILQLLSFKNTSDWNIKQLLRNTTITSSYPMKPIGAAIRRVKEQMVVEDDKKYKRITIKTNGGGVIVRDEVEGKEIKTKQQYYIKSGQLAVSKIDARNGAFGIVPPEADGAIITGNFWVFDVIEDVANIEYLIRVLSSERFVQAWLECSNGSGNRLYLQEKKFLSYNIPMPTVKMQNRIVATFFKTLQHALAKENAADNIHNDIEEYLMGSLNLHSINTQNNMKLLMFVPYKKISDRWEWNELSETIEKSIKDCIYPMIPLGVATSFVNRTWKKEQHSQEQFNYIEIGGIDAKNNTATASTVLFTDAPSRATQIVKEGDLIVGTTRPYLKRFALIRKSEDGYVCSSGFQVIEKSPNYDLKYILEVLKIEPTIKQFELKMTGALYPAVNSEQLKSIRIPVPPIGVQKAIASHIEQENDRIKTLYQEAEELKKQAYKEFEEAVFGE